MYIVGIAGGSGSGKSTFAEKILTLLRQKFSLEALHLHQDAYYLAKQPKSQYLNNKPNFDHPGAFDWPLLKKHLFALKKNKEVLSPQYDFTTNSRKEKKTRLPPSRVCLFDGIYALYDSEIRDILDLKVFLQVDADIRFIRRLHRDVKERGRNLDGVISQYYDSVRPMHRQFLEPTSIYADIVVGEETDKAAELVARHLSTQLV